MVSVAFPASKVSATSSNPSVLKVIDKYNIDFANYHPNMDIGIEIEAMKAGKATLTIQYKSKSHLSGREPVLE